MTKNQDAALVSLTNTYAKYFLADFPAMVLKHISASVPVDEAAISALVEEKMVASIDVNAVNPVSRFLYECAEFALESNLPDMASREVFDAIKVLPSMHHEEIQQLAYHSAEVYRATLDNTVINVIAKDANTTAELITASAKNRVSNTKTGGSVHGFTWGVLSDGLWLNNALMRSYEMAKVFRPGTKVDMQDAEIAFNATRSYTAIPELSEDQRTFSESGLAMVFNASDDRLTANVDLDTIKLLMFRPGYIARTVEHWQEGLRNNKQMIESVEQLSQLARLLPEMKEVASRMGEEVLGDHTIENRLEEVYNIVTLCLSGYEALRESSFSESLIIAVENLGNDPQVDVFVNEDNMQQFRMEGGTDEDLVHFGQFLDPRKGKRSPNVGWKVGWVLEQKDAVVAEMAASEAEMLEQMRTNDAEVIRNLAQHEIRNIVTTYVRATGAEEITAAMDRRIFDTAHTLATQSADESFSLERDIFTMLSDATALPNVQRAAQHLLDHASEEHARAKVIASMAMEDLAAMLTDS